MRKISPEDPALQEHSAPQDPIVLFEQWYAAACKLDYVEPGAMALATAGADGQPSVRMVLLKGYGPEGFVFYTNYQSRKGCELDQNPKAALAFYWDTLHRQVRVEGSVEQLPAATSDRYFASRPFGSQISASISNQSQPIANRDMLRLKYAELAKSSDHQPLRPPHWGGYRLIPHAMEFWQGRPDRLHDRLLYRQSSNGWTMQRIQP